MDSYGGHEALTLSEKPRLTKQAAWILAEASPWKNFRIAPSADGRDQLLEDLRTHWQVKEGFRNVLSVWRNLRPMQHVSGGGGQKNKRRQLRESAHDWTLLATRKHLGSLTALLLVAEKTNIKKTINIILYFIFSG